jgi:hypothetical protein
MGQVIFWRVRRGVSRCGAKHRASALAVSTDVGVISDGRHRAARTHTRESGQDTGCRPIRHSHKLGKVRCPESPACKAIPGLHTGHVTRRNADFRRLVTLTLQRCNAKNIFAARALITPVVPSHSACNVAQPGAKFHKNSAVSAAVNHSLNCIVYNRHHSATSPNRLGRVGMASRITVPRIFLTRLHVTAGGAR